MVVGLPWKTCKSETRTGAVLGSATGIGPGDRATLTGPPWAAGTAVSVVIAGVLIAAMGTVAVALAVVVVCPAVGVSCGNEIGLIRPGIAAGEIWVSPCFAKLLPVTFCRGALGVVLRGGRVSFPEDFCLGQTWPHVSCGRDRKAERTRERCAWFCPRTRAHADGTPVRTKRHNH